MKDNIREPNFSKNDYINESDQKNKIQTSSNKVAYQKLFTENSFDKKLKAKKCILNKKSLIISIIIITIILLILFIFAKIYFSPKKTKVFQIKVFLNLILALLQCIIILGFQLVEQRTQTILEKISKMVIFLFQQI